VIRFAMSWDRSLRISTAVVAGLLLLLAAGVPALVSATVGRNDPVAVAFGAVVAAVLLATLGLVWALAPRRIALGGGALRVERRLAPVVIPLSEVREVEVLAGRALAGALRLAGTSGAFGHYGLFSSRALGPFHLYATAREGLVRVDTARRRYVLSADDAPGRAAALLAAAPGARAGASGAAEAARRVRFRHLWLVLVAAALVPLLLGAVLAASWARAPRAISVRGGAVVVERNRAEPVALPLAGARVRVLHREDLAGLSRTAGVAFGDLRYGRFASDALGPFQLWAHVRGPMFLVERPDGRTVVTPDDPPAFFEAARVVPECKVLGAPPPRPIEGALRPEGSRDP
jgi:hypothetical protein